MTPFASLAQGESGDRDAVLGAADEVVVIGESSVMSGRRTRGGVGSATSVFEIDPFGYIGREPGGAVPDGGGSASCAPFGQAMSTIVTS